VFQISRVSFDEQKPLVSSTRMAPVLGSTQATIVPEEVSAARLAPTPVSAPTARPPAISTPVARRDVLTAVTRDQP
jgi:hypothetical protein